MRTLLAGLLLVGLCTDASAQRFRNHYDEVVVRSIQNDVAAMQYNPNLNGTYGRYGNAVGVYPNVYAPQAPFGYEVEYKTYKFLGIFDIDVTSTKPVRPVIVAKQKEKEIDPAMKAYMEECVSLTSNPKLCKENWEDRN